MVESAPDPAGAAPGGPVAVRASDADRERTAEHLRDQAGEGRLDATELEARLDAAYAARTTIDLQRLTADLPWPAPRPASRSLAARTEVRGQILQQAGGALGVFGVCVVVWAITTSLQGYFWPAWVLLAVGAGVVASAWRAFGPGGDPEAELARRAEAERERRGYDDEDLEEDDEDDEGGARRPHRGGRVAHGRVGH